MSLEKRNPYLSKNSSAESLREEEETISKNTSTESIDKNGIKSKNSSIENLKNEETILDLEDVSDSKLETRSISSKSSSETNKKKFLKKYKKFFYLVIILILYILYVIYYIKGLKGGDIFFINRELMTLAKYIIIASITFSLSICIITYMKIYKRVKAILYLIHIITVVIFVICDHGVLFDHHGTYNIMIFGAIVLIFNIVVFILYLWLRFAGKKWFSIQFTIFIIALVTVEGLLLRHYMNIWGDGYLNKKIEDGDQLCKIETPVPWFDLLPKGAQNFWTGSQSCKRKEHFDAFFENNKLVVRDCSEKEIIYKILPETRNMTYEEKKNIKYPVVDKMEANVHKYTEPVELNDIEAVYVNCGDQGKLVTRIAGRRVDPVKEEQPIEKLNVLVLYIDAVSRRQFFRSLPKTVKKLESLHTSGIMHLNQFFRYGVIGFNTLRNSNGLFAGMQYDNEHRGIPIWEEFRNRGYVAGVANDQCEDWDFTYNNRTAISLDHELIAPFCLPEYHERDGTPFSSFKGPYSFRRRCITGQYVHNYALNYTKEFIDLYDGTNPWFFHSSYIEAHESSSEVLALMDDDLERFFGSLKEETLNRTAIFLLSDHGLHMSYSFLFSNQGFVEHKLAMLTTFIPERFFNKYPELRKNIDENEQKLISAFDIYTTFRDILDFDISREPKEKTGVGIDISEAKLNSLQISIRKRNLNDWEIEKDIYNEKRDHQLFEKDRHTSYDIEEENTHSLLKRENKNGTIIWGTSLLRKVPYRTCEQALIYPEYCVCH